MTWFWRRPSVACQLLLLVALSILLLKTSEVTDPAKAGGVSLEQSKVRDPTHTTQIVSATTVQEGIQQDVTPDAAVLFTIFTVLPSLEISSIPLTTKWPYSHVQAVLAVKSWLALTNTEVLLFGDEPVCKEFMAQVTAYNDTRVSCHAIPCKRFVAGSNAIPTVDCLFESARKRAKHDLLMFSNVDILFFSDLSHTLTTLSKQTSSDFFLVGKRRDLDVLPSYNMSTPLPSSFFDQVFQDDDPKPWLQKLHQLSLQTAKNHPREGIDYMAFPKAITPKIPQFLIGRIQWDNWVLLQAIVDPGIVTFEAGDVIQAVHINHGILKASHEKAGTKYNQKLAVYLPHPYVRETKVHHRGTIWLGRLDEVDYNIVSSSNLHDVRRAEYYFANMTSSAQGMCPLCYAVKNEQSLDLLLYRHHALVRDRRFVVLVRASDNNLHNILHFACSLRSTKQYYYIFVADSENGKDVLRQFGLPVYLDDEKLAKHPMLRFLEVVNSVLSKAYHVFIVSSKLVPQKSIQEAVEGSGSSYDIMTLTEDQDTSCLRIMFISSRSRTLLMMVHFASLIENAIAKEHPAPNSWKESNLFCASWAQMKQLNVEDSENHVKLGEFDSSHGKVYTGFNSLALDDTQTPLSQASFHRLLNQGKDKRLLLKKRKFWRDKTMALQCQDS
eukprot:m.12344 g.12344  ORF g.12344 m.12344 type:complete len:666 (+) comp4637_c0_seq2:382-2379(+)